MSDDSSASGPVPADALLAALAPPGGSPRRRRRSLDTYGGISVADVMRQQKSTVDDAAESPPTARDSGIDAPSSGDLVRPSGGARRLAEPALPPPAPRRSRSVPPPVPAAPAAGPAGIDQPTRQVRPVASPPPSGSPTPPPPSRPAGSAPSAAQAPAPAAPSPAAPSPAAAPPVDRPWRNEPTQIIAAVTVGAEEDEPRTRLQAKRLRRRERATTAAKSLVVSLAVLVFVTTGGAWGTKAWYDSKFNQVAALDEESAHIQDAPAQLGDENFLMIGSDTRIGAEPGEGIGNADEIPGARSDTLMIAHVPADRRRAIVVSFPRDLEVARPDCQRWDPVTGEYSDEIVPGADIEKLTLVYSIGGPKCTLKLVQQLTGMKINHFVGIDFNGFKGMVDAVGGVQVSVEEPVVDQTLGTIVEEPGQVTFDGKKALDFVRARKVVGDVTSDYGRIKRQQQFISALLTKAMSRDVLFDPTKLTDFVTAFAAATFGDNIGVDQMLTLAQSMKGVSTDKITFLTVPTVGFANERGNEVLLEGEADTLFQAIIDNSPLPGEDPAASTQADAAQSGEPTG